jgi:DNA polymerase-3 subunit delta
LGLDGIEAFVTLEADELAASSKLRQLAERSPKVAVIGCYRDNDRDLGSTVDNAARELGIDLAPEARDYLLAHLGNDRAVTRRELEKLGTYALGATAPLSLMEVAAVVGDASALTLDDCIFAALGGDARRLDPLLDRLFKEGTAPMRVLRVMSMTVLTLYRMRTRLDAGEGLDAVLAGVRPPFGPVRDRYRAALQSSTVSSLMSFLDLLQETELKCKAARSPDILLCRRAMSSIAASQAPRRQNQQASRTAPRSGPPRRA